ncbi:MAG TPA: caspase family protein, partial [Myxococcota bacterium]
DAAAMRDLLDDLRARVAGSKARGDDVVVVVYYSGHASEGRLHLGTTRFEMRELRQRLDALGADVRLAFVDSCGAGAITREKGATLAAPFVITADQAGGVGATGQVIIASSSADEVSQESDEIQGSFFTHHLTTGLRGDADRDHDGVVTLDEAYAYAYGRTVAATSATRSGAQHPTYAFDLQGAGDVVLSRPGGADVVVEFPGELEGRYFVVDLDRQLFVAEVDKQKGGTSQIALPRGQYAIKKRLDSHLLMTRVQARSKGRIVVDDDTMQSVAFADDYAKGSPLGLNQIDDTVRFSFALGAVVTGVADPTGYDDGGLFPTTAGPQLRLRWNNLLRHRIALDLDASVGVARAVRTIDGGPALGITHLDVNVVATQMGASALWLQPILDGAVDVGIGPRVVGVLFTHRFVGDSKPVGLDGQSYVSFNPGVVGVVSWHFASWAHLELDARVHYLPYTVDQLRHLVSLEGMVSVWVDL